MAFFRDYKGERFEAVTVLRDGIECRACWRVIRVRERAARFPDQKKECDRYECKDCILNQPVNEHNEGWLPKLLAKKGGTRDVREGQDRGGRNAARGENAGPPRRWDLRD